MGDPTLVIVAHDVTEKFMPEGVTDPKRASSRLVWPRGTVVRQGDVDAYKARNEGADVELADPPAGVPLVLGRLVNLDPAPAVDQSALPDAKTAIAGKVPQNPDAPGAELSASDAEAAKKAFDEADDAEKAAAVGSTGDQGEAAEAPTAKTAGRRRSGSIKEDQA